ncbi:YbjN domain-containing protein [Alphaproteobacteria bacterium]|nr:YbjN domain-containing protein [Alphaproteobacteria bacterium]
MSLSYVDEKSSSSNPIELLEEIVGANDWAYERSGLNELAVEINGRWCNYRLFFIWQGEIGALHFSCVFETRVHQESFKPVHSLLAMINEKLWLGHFDLSSQDGTPMFRHTLLLRGAGPASVEQLEDLVDISVSESDRYYPAFQFVIWGGKTAKEALEAALIEVVGEA